MTLASYAATGFMVAGVHALLLAPGSHGPVSPQGLGDRPGGRGTAALLQPLSGDYSAKVVARTQPTKLAAMEGQFKTERARRCGSAAGPIPRPAKRGMLWRSQGP